MDENEITFIIDDDDERNARGSRDHRTKGNGFTRGAPARRTRHVVLQSGNREPVVVREAASAERVMYPPVSGERRLFGNLTASEAVEAAAQVLAAIQPLPVSPVATGRVETDVENLTLFHAALAMHAKRDEQLRTLGSLLAKLMS